MQISGVREVVSSLCSCFQFNTKKSLGDPPTCKFVRMRGHLIRVYIELRPHGITWNHIQSITMKTKLISKIAGENVLSKIMNNCYNFSGNKVQMIHVAIWSSFLIYVRNNVAMVILRCNLTTGLSFTILNLML